MDTVARRTFTMRACLGRGGFGEVYLARMHSAAGLQTDVAVKMLRSDLAPEGEAVRRLRDEGRLLARLDHPTIVRVFDFVRLEGRIGLVMEYVEGLDLSACLRGEERLPLRAALEAVGRVAEALAAAWDAPGPDGRPLQLVHRDVKPSNLRIGRHGEVKLLDFGIARSDAMGREAKTTSGVMVGSLPYAAPERFQGHELHPASDVFGLGCVLFEAVTGERFHQRGNARDISLMALDAERFERHLVGRMARVDPARGTLRDLLIRLLAFEPSARPAAGGVAAAVEHLADQVPGPGLRRWCRGRPWPVIQGIGGALEGQVLTEEGRVVTGPTPTAPEAGPEPQVQPETSRPRPPRPSTASPPRAASHPPSPAPRGPENAPLPQAIDNAPRAERRGAEVPSSTVRRARPTPAPLPPPASSQAPVILLALALVLLSAVILAGGLAIAWYGGAL